MVANSNELTSSSGRHIEFDDSGFPLVVARFRGPATDAEVDAYLARLERPLIRGESYVAIIDGTHAAPGTPVQRRAMAEWMRSRAKLIQTHVLGAAIVAPSSLIRGALTAIFWIQPLPCPHRITSTMEEAERWALGQLPP